MIFCQYIFVHLLLCPFCFLSFAAIFCTSFASLLVQFWFWIVQFPRPQFCGSQFWWFSSLPLLVLVTWVPLDLHWFLLPFALYDFHAHTAHGTLHARDTILHARAFARAAAFCTRLPLHARTAPRRARTRALRARFTSPCSRVHFARALHASFSRTPFAFARTPRFCLLHAFPLHVVGVRGSWFWFAPGSSFACLPTVQH